LCKYQPSPPAINHRITAHAGLVPCVHASVETLRALALKAKT
jgi:hypothetical protein